MMDMIGFDHEFMSDPCTHSKILLPIPENVRDVPCEGCTRADACGVSMAECVAFRVWSATGDFLDEDVGRLMRVPRELRGSRGF
jgi:hypothetical protein